MKYEICQKLWLASWESSEDWVTCPDCGGTGRLRVTFHDETTVSIHCAGCAAGYEPPTGFVRVYNRHARALTVTITGVEVRDGKTEWRTSGHYCPDEADLYENEDDCLAGALLKAKKADQEEREKVNAKARSENGTTALAAQRAGRDAMIIELNPEYAAMAERRISGDAPLLQVLA